MRVKCINNPTEDVHLTIGKEYVVKEEKEKDYILQCNGFTVTFPQSCFETASDTSRVRTLLICKKNAEDIVSWYQKLIEQEGTIEAQFPGALDNLWTHFQKTYSGEDEPLEAFYGTHQFQVVDEVLYMETSYVTLQWSKEKEFWLDPGEDDVEPHDYFGEEIS